MTMMALILGGLGGVLIRLALGPRPAKSTTRSCVACGLTVTGPRTYPRCPSCGTGLDVKAAS